MTRSAAALYKFLDGASACPMTGRRWPVPETGAQGAWIDRAGPLDPEGLGFLVFRSDDLAPWACSLLYRVEAEGEVTEAGEGVVIASRLRLLAPERRWIQISDELAEHARARVNALAAAHPRLAEYASDVAACVQHRMINGVLFVTAMACAVAADPFDSDPVARFDAFARERELQSRFIAGRLQG